MPLLKIRCPECNAPLKSSTGFTVGETVSCPKCETDFTVKAPGEEPEGDEKPAAASKGAGAMKPRKGADDADWDEDEAPRKKKRRGDEDDEPVRRSYKDSPLRYAVLGVLVVVMLVLAYMLYEKKKKEREAAEADDAPSSSGPSEPSTPNGPIPPPPGGVIPIAPPPPFGGPKVPVPPKGMAPTIAEAKNRLTGTWECKLGGGDVCTVEYRPDGTFTYTAKPQDEAAKAVAGRWALERVEQVTTPAPGMAQQTLLRMEWVINEPPSGSMKDAVVLRPDRKIQHPLLEQIKDGNAASSVFDRK